MIQAETVIHVDKASEPAKNHEKERDCCWNGLQNWKHRFPRALKSFQVVEDSQPSGKPSKCKYKLRRLFRAKMIPGHSESNQADTCEENPESISCKTKREEMAFQP
eukprot:Skav209916  [mRNA]  locus=scaffold1253:132125:133158:+ [translate_table: standard]